jgi:chromosome segregation ATPase
MIRNGTAIIAAAAAAFMALAAPASAHGREIVLDIGDGDLLEKLIALDADGIADMRADIAEARAEIAEAIEDIAEAKAEVDEAPAGARFIVRIAFSAARAATEAAVSEALDEVHDEIDDAEKRLKTADVSVEERAETQGAIDALREDLASLEDSLEELFAALRA